MKMFLVADALRVEKRETGVALLYRARNDLQTGKPQFSPFFIVFIVRVFGGGSSDGAFRRIMTAQKRVGDKDYRRRDVGERFDFIASKGIFRKNNAER